MTDSDDTGQVFTRSPARLLAIVAVGVTAVAAFAPAAAAEPERGLTISSTSGYYGTTRLAMTGCEYRTTKSRAKVTFTVPGKRWQVLSTATNPVPGTVTVRTTELGNPGQTVALTGECELGEEVSCSPQYPTTCLGTALLSHTRSWRVPFPQYLAPGASLGPGQSVSTGPGGHRLTLTAAGNLVHRAPDGRVLWQSGTSGPNPRLHAGEDGNVVLRAGTSRRAIWSTRTQGNPGARLVLKPQGGMAVYSASGRQLWQTTAATWTRMQFGRVATS